MTQGSSQVSAQGWLAARLTALLCCLSSAQLSAEPPPEAKGEPAQLTAASPIGAPRFLIGLHGALKVERLSDSALARVFSGRQRLWPSGGVSVQLILLPQGSEEMKRLSERLKMPEHLVRRFINQRVYQGTMRSPIEVQSSAEALLALQATPGAIAPLLIREGAPLTPGVKLLSLEP